LLNFKLLLAEQFNIFHAKHKTSLLNISFLRKQIAESIIASLSSPKECNQKFSDEFEEKMQSLIKGIAAKSCTVVIQDSIIYK